MVAIRQESSGIPQSSTDCQIPSDRFGISAVSRLAASRPNRNRVATANTVPAMLPLKDTRNAWRWNSWAT
jgi:hypothetical protein